MLVTAYILSQIFFGKFSYYYVSVLKANDFIFTLLYFCLNIVRFVAAQTSSSVESVELQLVQDLMSNYDVNARPVVNPGDTVNVEIGAALQQIVDLVRIELNTYYTGRFL